MRAKFVGILLILIGVGVLMFSFIPHVSDGDARFYQQELVKEYKAGNDDGPTQAILKVPAFGVGYEMPIVDSVDQDVLDTGVVGHFPETGPLGEGNYALAGHVVTNGQPFAELGQLRPGDIIIVQQGSKEYRFVVTDFFTVDYTDTSVLDYKPKTITLVTCASRYYSTDERLVVVGKLRSSSG